MAPIEHESYATYHNLPARDANRVRIGLCTDTHVWVDGVNNHGSEGNLQLVGESVALLDTLVDELSARELDLTIHLGDFTCGGGYFGITEADFYRGADLNRAAFDRLAAPVFGLPGNHDCPPGGDNWRHVEEQWGLLPGLGLTLDTPFARLILLNAQGHSAAQVEAAQPDDPIYGWVNEAELARLDSALSSANDRPVLLFVHQLLQPWRGPRKWADFYLVQNAPAVLDVLAAHDNVRAVFQGHAHMFEVHTDLLDTRPCTFVITPSVVEYPLGWLELELTADQLTVALRQLPRPNWREKTLRSGNGQNWRAGRADWHRFSIDLA